MIELVEAPYDGPAGRVLVPLLYEDLCERYPRSGGPSTAEELAQAEAEWFAEVLPEQVRRPHGCFVVAVLDGEPVACGALKPLRVEWEDAPRPGLVEVKRMFTRPTARRQGISRALLAHLEAVAVELGYREAWLETGTAQPEAMALYAAAGWTPIEAYGHFRAEPWTACFAKGLAPA